VNDNGEERTDILVLVDDEGNEHDFALVDRFRVDLQEYAILVPVLYFEDTEDEDYIDFEDEAYIFRIEKGTSEQNNNISENLYDHFQTGTVVTEDTAGSIPSGSGGGKKHADEQEFLVEVEDEEEWSRVAARWEERVKTSENNDDEGLS